MEIAQLHGPLGEGDEPAPARVVVGAGVSVCVPGMLRQAWTKLRASWTLPVSRTEAGKSTVLVYSVRLKFGEFLGTRVL